MTEATDLGSYQGRLVRREQAFFTEVMKLCREICPEMTGLLLYGSRAENKAKRTSDWDFLVFIPSETTPERMVELASVHSGERRFGDRVIDLQYSREDERRYLEGDIEFAIDLASALNTHTQV